MKSTLSRILPALSIIVAHVIKLKTITIANDTCKNKVLPEFYHEVVCDVVLFSIYNVSPHLPELHRILNTNYSKVLIDKLTLRVATNYFNCTLRFSLIM